MVIPYGFIHVYPWIFRSFPPEDTTGAWRWFRCGPRTPAWRWPRGDPSGSLARRGFSGIFGGLIMVPWFNHDIIPSEVDRNMMKYGGFGVIEP